MSSAFRFIYGLERRLVILTQHLPEDALPTDGDIAQLIGERRLERQS